MEIGSRQRWGGVEYGASRGRGQQWAEMARNLATDPANHGTINNGYTRIAVPLDVGNALFSPFCAPK